MTMNEAQEFLKEYGEILENDDLFEKFKRGEDLSLHFAEQMLEERKGLEDEYQDLLERRSMGDESVKTQIRELELLLMYRGEFANLTQAQIEYNELKERGEILNKLGLLTDEKRAEIQEVRRKGSLEFINELGSEAEKYLNSIDEIEEGLYDIIDGVAVVNKEVFDQLSEAQKGLVTD